MILYPAVDICGGHAVRLIRGDYDRETVYDADPVDAACRWVGQGARFLHVVDLDGAREGRPVNLAQVRRIAAGVEVPIQLGGGLRGSEAIAEALAAGVSRVVLGTAAHSDPGLVGELVAEHGERIVVSVDARQGNVAVSGWTRETETAAPDLLRALAERGVTRFVYTPVEVDGTLEGPALDDLRVAAEVTDAELIYSGGVGSLDDLRALAGLGHAGVTGVIVGRALYEGRFTVAEGQRALGGP
ncbi:MAG: 1-(5-phosphoribosyl)-5-[(5-phosphoribosylamino)methylideneamino]imidazole-4-carboxamide isomerase [Solirubrobacterales bacterium]